MRRRGAGAMRDARSALPRRQHLRAAVTRWEVEGLCPLGARRAARLPSWQTRCTEVDLHSSVLPRPPPLSGHSSSRLSAHQAPRLSTAAPTPTPRPPRHPRPRPRCPAVATPATRSPCRRTSPAAPPRRPETRPPVTPAPAPRRAAAVAHRHRRHPPRRRTRRTPPRARRRRTPPPAAPPSAPTAPPPTLLCASSSPHRQRRRPVRVAPMRPPATFPPAAGGEGWGAARAAQTWMGAAERCHEREDEVANAHTLGLGQRD